MTVYVLDEVREATDVDRLWQTLLAAKESDDGGLVRAVENRMRELGPERRFAHLSDAELEGQIAAMQHHRAPEGMIGHSPGGGDSGDAGVGDLMKFNEAIRANQHDKIEVTLMALLGERSRRQARAAG